MSGYLLHNLLTFGRILWGLGLHINPGRMIDLSLGLDAIQIGNKADFYHALRCFLVHNHEDFGIFDKVFEQFWRNHDARENKIEIDRLNGSLAQPMFVSPLLQNLNVPNQDTNNDQENGEDLPPILELTLTYSPQEALRQKDFAEMTVEEMDQVKRLITELVWQFGDRRTRRQLPGSGPHLDLRRSLRRNLRYGGEIIEWARKRPKYKPRPLVILADISGSMERYTRLFLHFIYSLSWGLSQKVEVFVFSTRLTRITRLLRNRDIGHALKDISSHVPDWSGGTRIGGALKNFNFEWARRVLGSGAVVLFISDGWDRGDPQQMGIEMARLKRSCHRLIWLNPLLGSPEFEPLTRGTQFAFGHVDDFLPVHNLSSLEALAENLAHLSPRGRSRTRRSML